MSGQVTITQLPVAGAITGTESVPIVQNGVTVQTTTGAISGAGALNYPFLTVNTTAGLSQARYLATGSGLSLTDNGAGSTLQIVMTGTANALNSTGVGIIVKTGTNTVSSVSLAVGTGMTISNANGTAGNPTIGLNANLQNLSSLSGIGILAINGSSFTPFTLQGTTNQISIANGNAASGSPTISIYPNPILPGTGSVTLPIGTTAQRVGSNGALRYNTDISSLEAYANGSWGSIVSGSGVSTFSAGSTGLTPGTTTTGNIILGGTLNASSGGTGVAGTLTGYVYGNGTGVMTASTTVPTTALSGTVTNAQLANSAITINGSNVSLGGSVTISASTTSTLTIGTGLSGTSFNGSTPVTIAIANTGVTAGTYGSSLAIPQITVNAQGQITSISTNASSATTYQGTWNASTNTPTLVSSVGTAGYYYVVSVAGTTSLNGINLWSVGDWAVFNGSAWEKVLGSSSEAFNNITVTGLTGYMYANGTSQVTASTTIPVTSLSGLGTGVATALAVNTGTAGAFVVNGGALGTPSSGIVTNLTGTASININGTVGATTPTTGAFTTISASGVITSTVTTGTAPFTVSSTTTVANLGATNTVNTGITATSSGTTNYLTFVTATSGNLPQLVNSSITANAVNGTITGGIAGGTF